MMLEAEGELRTHRHTYKICASTAREGARDKSECLTHANALQFRKFACQLSLPTLLDKLTISSVSVSVLLEFASIARWKVAKLKRYVTKGAHFSPRLPKIISKSPMLGEAKDLGDKLEKRVPETSGDRKIPAKEEISFCMTTKLN